jgi:hypothetical protein
VPVRSECLLVNPRRQRLEYDGIRLFANIDFRERLQSLQVKRNDNFLGTPSRNLQVLACAPLHFHSAAQMMLQGTLIEFFLPPRHD